MGHKDTVYANPIILSHLNYGLRVEQFWKQVLVKSIKVYYKLYNQTIYVAILKI